MKKREVVKDSPVIGIPREKPLLPDGQLRKINIEESPRDLLKKMVEHRADRVALEFELAQIELETARLKAEAEHLMKPRILTKAQIELIVDEVIKKLKEAKA